MIFFCRSGHYFVRIRDAGDDARTPYWRCVKCPMLQDKQGRDVTPKDK